MGDIELCCKKIFDVLHENCDLQKIAECASEIMNVSVFFILASGKVAASASRDKWNDGITLIKNYISLESYDLLQKIRRGGRNQEKKEHSIEIKDVYVFEQFIGYVVIEFGLDDSEEDITQLSEVLVLAMNICYQDKEIELHKEIPIRKHLLGNKILRGG